MPYERSRTIEERFQKTLVLLKDKRLNARQLALELDVSRPTIHRIITELKRRGHSIRSAHEEHGWAYEIADKSRLPNNDKPSPKRKRIVIEAPQTPQRGMQPKESRNGTLPR